MMEHYTVNGYGFPVESVNCYDIVKFLKNHADKTMYSELWGDLGEALNDILADIDLDSLEYMKEDTDFDNFDINDPSVEKFYSIVDDISDYSEDNKDIITAIIEYELDGINLSYEPGQSDECIGYASIILKSGMPWDYNNTEKKLTEEGLKKLFTPYAKELGIAVSEIGYLEIGYFG